MERHQEGVLHRRRQLPGDLPPALAPDCAQLACTFTSCVCLHRRWSSPRRLTPSTAPTCSAPLSCSTSPFSSRRIRSSESGWDPYQLIRCLVFTRLERPPLIHPIGQLIFRSTVASYPSAQSTTFVKTLCMEMPEQPSRSFPPARLLLSLLSLLPHASGLSTAAALPLRGRQLHRRSCIVAAAAVEPSGLEHWSPQVEQPSDLGPVAAQLRFGWLRRAYGEYAERCNEYASSVEGPVARFTTRPVRWVRALLPKPRPLAQLALCEGGTFKVRREGLSRVMIFEEEGCEVPDIDLL